MKILVTGGAGFIGSNIVDRLINEGHKVVVVDNLSTGKRDYIHNEAKFYEMDINSNELEKILIEENITHVIHHAAQIDVQKSVEDPMFDAKNNILGMLNLLECCKLANVEKIVYASSAAVYGEPDYLPLDESHPIKAMSPYGISKHTPEHYLRMYKHLYDLNYTILRYSNVYGPRQDPKGEGGVVSIFVDRMLDRENPVIYGDGKQTRDFVYVGDIVSANIQALNNGDNQLVNISCNTKDSINDLYQIINNILRSDMDPIYEVERDGDIRHSIMDNVKAKEIINWEPKHDLQSGLIKTIEYYAREMGLDEVAASLES
jgi:UDP-glucose 4-epimerase